MLLCCQVGYISSGCQAVMLYQVAYMLSWCQVVLLFCSHIFYMLSFCLQAVMLSCCTGVSTARTVLLERSARTMAPSVHPHPGRVASLRHNHLMQEMGSGSNG